MLIQNKTAVITGCNRGIGKKILEAFSANGATIFACVRNVSEEFKTFANEMEKEFYLQSPSDAVMSVLKMAKLDVFFNISN